MEESYLDWLKSQVWKFLLVMVLLAIGLRYLSVSLPLIGGTDVLAGIASPYSEHSPVIVLISAFLTIYLIGRVRPRQR